MKRICTIVVVMAMAALLAVPVLADDHPANEPLKAAVDMGYVPFAFVTEQGEEVGFLESRLFPSSGRGYSPRSTQSEWSSSSRPRTSDHLVRRTCCSPNHTWIPHN